MTTPKILHGFAVHPAAALFPLIEGDDFVAFVKDIREHGLQEPVTVDPDGLLLDGRNRVRACAELGVEVVTKVYDGPDVAQYVVSHNVHRRHLTDSQRAMVAARLANLPNGTNRHTLASPSGEARPTTRGEARNLLKVSEGSMTRAKAIVRSGTPALQALADTGDLPLTTGARIAEMPPAEQDAYVEQVKAGGVKKHISQRERVAMIRKLAAKGYSSRQIAEEVGVRDGWVRDLARKFDVEIQADKVIGKTRRTDSNRIAREVVDTLHGLAMSLELVEYGELDTAEAVHWAASLNESFPALSRFRKHIKETAQ